MPLQLSGRIISGIQNGRKIFLATTHMFLLLTPHHRERLYLDLPGNPVLITEILVLPEFQ